MLAIFLYCLISTIVCKDVDRTFELEYSTYCILNRSELCECSLTAGNYLLSQTAFNCGGMPKVKDGFFTTYYAFNRIVLDMLMEKFDIQVDDDTITQLMLLHSDIPGYDLPAIDFVSPSGEAQESHTDWVCLYWISSENWYFRLQKPITFYFFNKSMWILYVEK